jgi:hypothetical protein
MTKLKTTLTISTIATILIIGGFVSETPNAFSTYGGNHNNDHNNNHDDDCDDRHHDKNRHDDCNDESKDPCDCEKPDTLKFIFSTPSGETDSEFRIEVYKKLNDIGNTDKKLMNIAGVINLGDYQIESSNFGKDKLNSNTVIAIYKIVENQDDVLVSSMEIHTSCSQPLYKGLTVIDNNYAIEITDGLKNGKRSISESDPRTCEDSDPVKTGSITIRKALTNDNGGDAIPADFTIMLTNVETNEEIILNHDQDESSNPLVNLNKVPVGTYKISESIADTVTATYTTVLITGDNQCPTMVEEEFTIKKGKSITCTIYNDDNGDGSGGPGGIVFQNNSMEINIEETAIDTLDSCDHYVNGIKTDPCIQIIGDSGNIGIVDSELSSTTTIVLFSVVEKVIDPDEGATNADCRLERIIAHDSTSDFLRDNDGNLPVNPTDNLMVFLGCSGIDSGKVYKVNYVMIDPTMGS